ncbi:MAG TPA: response regulator [Lamprocystis sp. (in: g-proteobacteria)]|nr:response regulator [Lamprocystis sp. (in: g-proteobacteria)]
MKILLVDDSKSARYALRLLLQGHGVEVETADSAESALALLKGNLPDAIMMDQMMPGLSGFEAIEIIRSDERTAQLPVVICTSTEDPEFAAAAHRKGITGILPKSVAAEKLPEILTRLTDLIARRSTPPNTTAKPAAPSTPQATAAVAPDLLQQFEGRLDGLVDERLQAHWPKLIEPLLADLKRDLHERLLAEARQLIETRIGETRASFEAATTAKAQEAARRAANEAVTAALKSSRPGADVVVEPVRASQIRLNMGIVAAGLSGLLAATLVYFLVR